MRVFGGVGEGVICVAYHTIMFHVNIGGAIVVHAEAA